MAKSIVDVVLKSIDEQRDSIKEFLVTGGAKDFTSYREVCGVVRGLDSVRTYLEDLSRSYMEMDND